MLNHLLLSLFTIVIKSVYNGSVINFSNHMTYTDRDDHMTESERADIDREHMLLWVDEVASGETPLLSVPGHWRFDPLFQDELARKLGLGSTVLQYVKLKALEDVLLKRLEQAGKKSCTCQVSANTVRSVTNHA